MTQLVTSLLRMRRRSVELHRKAVQQEGESQLLWQQFQELMLHLTEQQDAELEERWPTYARRYHLWGD